MLLLRDSIESGQKRLPASAETPQKLHRSCIGRIGLEYFELVGVLFQGVCARRAPAVYRNHSDGPSGPSTNAAPLWLINLQDLGLVKTVTIVESAGELLSHLQRCVTGYVKCDPSSPNTALTAASGSDVGVVVGTDATEKLLREQSLTLEMDVTNMTVLQV